MKRTIAALAALATLGLTATASAAGTAPTAPLFKVTRTTQHGIYIQVTKASCDADGDWGNGHGSYRMRIDGAISPDPQVVATFNCSPQPSPYDQFVFGDGSFPGQLPPNTGHTVSLRSVDDAGHSSAWTNITGVKTQP